MKTMKNQTEALLFTELMIQIKKNNLDYLTVRKSKEYRIGYEITEAIQMLKNLSLKEIKKEYAVWLAEKRIKRKKFHKTEERVGKKKPDFFSDDRIAIYTCIFGSYDGLIEPDFIPDNCDFYVVTDMEIPQDSAWKKKDISIFQNKIKNFTNVEKNRFFKINPHLIFNEYKYSIYVDGNVEIVSDLTEYIHEIGESGLAFHLHPGRSCVYDEAEAILIHKKDTAENIKKEIEHLNEEKMPRRYGMCECNVIVREHHNPICTKVMTEWWSEFSRYAKRDQLSLPLVLYKNGISITQVAVLGDNVKMNPSFRVIRHK